MLCFGKKDKKNARCRGCSFGFFAKKGLLWPEWMSRGKLAAERSRCRETPGVGLGVYYRMWEAKVVGDRILGTDRDPAASDVPTVPLDGPERSLDVFAASRDRPLSVAGGGRRHR